MQIQVCAASRAPARPRSAPHSGRHRGRPQTRIAPAARVAPGAHRPRFPVSTAHAEFGSYDRLDCENDIGGVDTWDAIDPELEELFPDVNARKVPPTVTIQHREAFSVHAAWSYSGGRMVPPARMWEVELWRFDFSEAGDEQGEHHEASQVHAQLVRLGAARLDDPDARETHLESLRPSRRYKVRVRAVFSGGEVGPWSAKMTADTLRLHGPSDTPSGPSERFWHKWSNARVCE